MARPILSMLAALIVMAFASGTCLAGGVGNTSAFVNSWTRRTQINCKPQAAKPAPPKPKFELQAPRHTPIDSGTELRGTGAAVATAVTPVFVSLTLSSEVVGTVTPSVTVRPVQVRYSSVVVERRLPLQI